MTPLNNNVMYVKDFNLTLLSNLVFTKSPTTKSDRTRSMGQEPHLWLRGTLSLHGEGYTSEEIVGCPSLLVEKETWGWYRACIKVVSLVLWSNSNNNVRTEEMV